MPAAAIEVQTALFAALRADADLTAIVGDRVFDHAPANVAFPCISFGRAAASDWSTATEDGVELLLTLHVWSKAKGKREALEIMDAVRAVLHDAAPALDEHRLVNLRLVSAEARYDEDQAVQHGLMRLRAVTEPA